MHAIKRMGILYGKLGLSTDASLIERRGSSIEEAADALEAKDIPEILRYVFGIGRANAAPGFLSHFSNQDPTFDVQPRDHEAALLASAVVAFEMERESDLNGLLALCLVTASFGGIRPPLVDDQLLKLGDKTLAHAQSAATLVPPDRRYMKQPKELTDAATSLQNSNINVALPHMISSIQQLGKYSEANALAAAKSDNDILGYVRRLEDELRTHWWVTGGWSTDAGVAFRTLTPIEAALRAGKELADKNGNKLGLFSAPALLSMVIETGRKVAIKDMALTEAATLSNRVWRLDSFGAEAEKSLADLLPVTSALGLAALSDDADDWQPRFKRFTNIDPRKKLHPLDIALQLYRERLVLRALEV
ncbi:MAG: GTPase-associated system all-helical protein GASH [Fluviicoccus sp.]|uniref:GTPase-associated system all-helical protein GASH n=1 Tax=Fluviicoccus sp. TaxID=2003552 RepID=UPI00271ACEFB|nr:GTPase-associated system all-helical protein GASH [Fluviicoccus sp.]MDO8329806.1 GTPase-associated system all-helical protein GASH [Fluviicoccus sp.]